MFLRGADTGKIITFGHAGMKCMAPKRRRGVKSRDFPAVGKLSETPTQQKAGASHYKLLAKQQRAETA
eukprot:scaffold196755_cov17-Tisochrysis_lutea.AAC.1